MKSTHRFIATNVDRLGYIEREREREREREWNYVVLFF